MQRVVATVTVVDSRAQGATPRPSFDQLFARYHGPIYGHILGLVGDPAQAEDLTQDTFLKAYKVLPGAREGAVVVWRHEHGARRAAPPSPSDLVAVWPRRRGARARARGRPADASGHAGGRAPGAGLAHPDAARLPAAAGARAVMFGLPPGGPIPRHERGGAWGRMPERGGHRATDGILAAAADVGVDGRRGDGSGEEAGGEHGRAKEGAVGGDRRARGHLVPFLLWADPRGGDAGGIPMGARPWARRGRNPPCARGRSITRPPPARHPPIWLWRIGAPCCTGAIYML